MREPCSAHQITEIQCLTLNLQAHFVAAAEIRWPMLGRVIDQPLGLYHGADLQHGNLLILTGKIVLRHSLADPHSATPPMSLYISKP